MLFQLYTDCVLTDLGNPLQCHFAQILLPVNKFIIHYYSYIYNCLWNISSVFHVPEFRPRNSLCSTYHSLWSVHIFASYSEPFIRGHDYSVKFITCLSFNPAVPFCFLLLVSLPPWPILLFPLCFLFSRCSLPHSTWRNSEMHLIRNPWKIYIVCQMFLLTTESWSTLTFLAFESSSMRIGHFRYFPCTKKYRKFRFLLGGITKQYSFLTVETTSRADYMFKYGSDVNINPVLFNDDFLIVHDQQCVSNSSNTSTIFCTSLDLFTYTFPFRYVFFS